jgi:hypothetical protein
MQVFLKDKIKMGGKKSKESEVKSRITEQDRAVLVYKLFTHTKYIYFL